MAFSLSSSQQEEESFDYAERWIGQSNYPEVVIDRPIESSADLSMEK